MSEERLLTALEVAEVLNVKPGTVYAWAQQGYLPSIHMGTCCRDCVRFRRSTVVAWLADREKSGRPTRMPPKFLD